MYVDGNTFAEDLGATYTEIETDAYVGFEISYESENYYVYGNSFLIKDSAEGQMYACEYNDLIDKGVKTSFTIMDILVTAITGGGNKYAQGFATVVTAGTILIDFSDVDFSYKVQVRERITTSQRVVAASSTTTFRTTVRDINGKIRIDQKQYAG